jgi:hypothetical protein
MRQVQQTNSNCDQIVALNRDASVLCLDEGWRVASGSGGMTYLRGELTRRFRGPMGHFAFWVFLGLGALFFGGFGVWFEMGRWATSQPGASADGLHTAMFTYFTALAGASTLQLVFEDGQKPLRVFAILCAAIFVVLAVWQSWFKPSDPILAFAGVSVGSILALGMWWLTSGQDEALKDNIKPDSAVGGDPSKTPHGNLDGFKS